MDYRSLLTRFFSSLILILFFIIFLVFFKDYLNLLFILIYIIIFYEVNKYFEFKKLIFIYLFISLLFLQIYFIYYFDLSHFLFLVFVIISFDTSSYFFGSLFGRKKIFKNISPNKTYFGLYSGCIFTITLAFILNINFKIFSPFICLYLSITYIISSFLGDIIESYFKRVSKIKNSSNFIPGHGGFFDRFDSFILCSFSLYLNNLLFYN